MWIRRAWLWVGERTGIYRWEDDPRTVRLKERDRTIRLSYRGLKDYYRAMMGPATREDHPKQLRMWHARKQKNRCNGCGTLFTANRPATLDHIVPMSRGGMTNRRNTQALCRECNLSKGNRTA